MILKESGRILKETPNETLKESIKESRKNPENLGRIPKRNLKRILK